MYFSAAAIAEEKFLSPSGVSHHSDGSSLLAVMIVVRFYRPQACPTIPTRPRWTTTEKILCFYRPQACPTIPTNIWGILQEVGFGFYRPQACPTIPTT